MRAFRETAHPKMSDVRISVCSHRQTRCSMLPAILGLCLSASAAPAQPMTRAPTVGGASRAEVLAGVTGEAPEDVNQPPRCQELSLPCLSPRTFYDIGGALSIAGHLGDRLAVVGEAAAYRNRWDAFQTSCPPAGGRTPSECSGPQVNHVRSILAGLRVRTAPFLWRGYPPELRVFGQVLIGTQWSSVVPGRRAIQPGGGLDIYLRNGITIRLEGDYCWVPGGFRDLSTSRTLIGIVIPLGETKP
jgi:hypothetical protein